MTISFILNGEDVVIQASMDERLLHILHETFHLKGTHGSCNGGHCGLCGVFLNNRLVPACIIPAFKLQGSEVITIEGFTQTLEYQDIIQGIDQAGVHFCGYCRNATILSIEDFLLRFPRPSSEEMGTFCSFMPCRCVSPKERLEVLQRVIDIRRRRMYGRSS
ncbi:MAG: 2Fe-2S iron-sulfur cluster-binding protein [Treponemataceae bacterium]|nr:2Fe-2S iron-sulfur cluster-binding protein [Treponemataceae bacterium]